MKAGPSSLDLILISKRGCHLCDAVEVELKSMTPGASVSVLFVDDEPELYHEYWLRVPVVRVKGSDVFEAKAMDTGGEWKEHLARIVGKAVSG